MSGYSINQLLKWTLEDRLIDGYAIASDGSVVIRLGGREHVLKQRRAEELLCDLIRRIDREQPDA